MKTGPFVKTLGHSEASPYKGGAAAVPFTCQFPAFNFGFNTLSHCRTQFAKPGNNFNLSKLNRPAGMSHGITPAEDRSYR
jgi:hypothetical protein